MDEENVLGGPLQACGEDPPTGFLRDGFCRYTEKDRGRHQICAVMTEAFLRFSRSRGNDLTTPRPRLNFPGLEPGDRWCVCLARWVEALEAECAPPVVLDATSKAALAEVPLKTLRRHDHRETAD